MTAIIDREIGGSQGDAWRRPYQDAAAVGATPCVALPSSASLPSLCEAASKADFTGVRYSQCWEDADVLINAARIKPGDTVLSICSAGDNTLALLAQNPAKVIALDLSPAQLACLELRVAAFAALSYDEVLTLLGFRGDPNERVALYKRCRAHMTVPARLFWDGHQHAITSGAGSMGRFERYFQMFRTIVLPLIHPRSEVDDLLTPRSHDGRHSFFHRRWNNRRWRALFSLFFSRFTMGLLGRDASFFQYVKGSVSQFLHKSTEHALTELDPSENPYLHWILQGHFGSELPAYLRLENFDTIRSNLSKLEWEKASVEEFLATAQPGSIDVFNLSDIFEYMSMARYHQLLELLVERAAPGARLIYWNMLAPRERPDQMNYKLTPNTTLSESLYKRNKTFFYSKLVIEETKC